ncbi:MAG: DUF3108 domain-containing protein [Kiritimatiellae bacterium]|nr:DUF3108 domain-containing protein [Kiritimatiellia bacterium]
MALVLGAEDYPFAPPVRDGPAVVRERRKEKPGMIPPVGEHDLFVIRWGVLPVGELHIWTEWAPEGAQSPECGLVLCGRVRSNRALSPVFSLDGFYESVMDPEAFEPLRATWSCVERRRIVAEWLRFDRGAGVLRRAVSDRDPLSDVPLSGGLWDVGGAIWWFRRELSFGRRPERLRVAVGRDVVEVVPGERGPEPVALASGVVRCRRFEPEVWRGGRRLERNRYVVWLEAESPHAIARLQLVSPLVTLVATRVTDGRMAVRSR